MELLWRKEIDILKRILPITLLLMLSLVNAACETLYPIHTDDYCGYIDKFGDIVIKQTWVNAGRFDNGTAVVQISQGEYCEGIINSDGVFILEPNYSIIDYDCGYVIQTNSKGTIHEGYYDKLSGNLIEPCYDIVIGASMSEEQEPVLVQDGIKYHYVDRHNGGILYTFYSDGISDENVFCNGYAIIQKTNGCTYIIDIDGNEYALDEGIRICSSFDENGLAVIESNGLYGYVNTEGVIVVEPTYYAAESFSDGFASVCDENGLWGVINSDNNLVIPYRYACSDGFYFNNNYAIIHYNNNDKEIINENGKRIYYAEYKDAHSLTYIQENSLFIRKVFDEYKIIYPCGALAAPITFCGYHEIANNNISKYADGRFAICKNGLWGYIDERCQLVIPCIYDDAQPFHEGLALVVLEGKQRYITPEGLTVWKE